METRFHALPDGRRLAYHDSGGPGAPLLALHGHFGRGRGWAGLIQALRPAWRVVALDQRGHGRSDRAPDYDREGYVADAAAVVQALGLAPAVVVGHSLGGVNAYQLAARHPGLVRALVVVDAPADVSPHPDPHGWDAIPERFASLAELRAAVPGPYQLESAVEHDDGWGFRFAPADVTRSRHLLTGDHWEDWCGSAVPALLVHGHRSRVLATPHAREMAARRPLTELVEIPDAAHTPQLETPEAFLAAVTAFLRDLA